MKHLILLFILVAIGTTIYAQSNSNSINAIESKKEIQSDKEWLKSVIEKNGVAGILLLSLIIVSGLQIKYGLVTKLLERGNKKEDTITREEASTLVRLDEIRSYFDDFKEMFENIDNKIASLDKNVNLNYDLQLEVAIPLSELIGAHLNRHPDDKDKITKPNLKEFIRK